MWIWLRLLAGNMENLPERSKRESHKFTQTNTAAHRSSGNTKKGRPQVRWPVPALPYPAARWLSPFLPVQRGEVCCGTGRPLGTAQAGTKGSGCVFKSWVNSSIRQWFLLPHKLFVLCLESVSIPSKRSQPPKDVSRLKKSFVSSFRTRFFSLKQDQKNVVSTNLQSLLSSTHE